jgi:hypothetical protein
MKDESPWDHLDYSGKQLRSVQGSIDIKVNDLTNSGQVTAEFLEGTDRYRIVFDRFGAKQAFQNGGIATRVYEHGDSGNGDPLYPKTWLYLAGWGTATMWKNDQVQYKDYDAHFMVMERSRDPKTHEVHYPVKRTLPGGETDPAGMEIDLWVRSKKQNTKNFPPYETFVHLYWEEVTWRKPVKLDLAFATASLKPQEYLDALWVSSLREGQPNFLPQLARGRCVSRIRPSLC